MLKSCYPILITSVLYVGIAAHADYKDTWSLPVGTEIPPISMSDQNGETQSFESLRGARGLLLFFNRSADW